MQDASVAAMQHGMMMHSHALIFWLLRAPERPRSANEPGQPLLLADFDLEFPAENDDNKQQKEEMGHHL